MAVPHETQLDAGPGIPSPRPWRVNEYRDDAWEVLDALGESVFELTYVNGNAEDNIRLILDRVNAEEGMR